MKPVPTLFDPEPTINIVKNSLAFHITFVVRTKKSSEKPAMVKRNASRNLLRSATPFMIAPPCGA
jgi:hypothetical protein